MTVTVVETLSIGMDHFVMYLVGSGGDRDVSLTLNVVPGKAGDGAGMNDADGQPSGELVITVSKL